MESMPLYKQAGGAEKLKAVIEDFYERVFADIMIGFFFNGKNKRRLIEKELEFAMKTLGADIEYTGRQIDEVHAHLKIMGGQFDRRLQILKNTIKDHDLPSEVYDAWISHSESLRFLVTANPKGKCDHN